MNKMRIYNLIILISLLISCDFKKKDTTPIINIKEFRHVIEAPNEFDDGYNYSYYEGKFDSIELRELKKIFKSKKVNYYISYDGRIYIDSDKYMPVTSAFVLQGNLVDSIMSKNLKPSPFVKEIIKSIPIEHVPERWKKSIETWFSDF